MHKKLSIFRIKFAYTDSVFAKAFQYNELHVCQFAIPAVDVHYPELSIGGVYLYKFMSEVVQPLYAASFWDFKLISY